MKKIQGNRVPSPKGLGHFHANQQFRNVVKDILSESKSFITGSSLDTTNHEDYQLLNDFGMDFQNFIDEWIETKFNNNNERGNNV